LTVKRTQSNQPPPWRIIDVGPPVLTYGESGDVVLPRTVKVEIDADPQLIVEFGWSQPTWGYVPYGIRTVDIDGWPVRLPPALQRPVAAQQIGPDLVRTVARQTVTGRQTGMTIDRLIAYGEFTDTDPDTKAPAPVAETGWDDGEEYISSWRELSESDGGTWPHYQRVVAGNKEISQGQAEILSRGKAKTRESIAMMRRRAETLGAQLVERGIYGNDLYDRVSSELGLSRTTAHKYMRDAGLVGDGRPVEDFRQRAAALATELLAEGITGRRLYERVGEELGVSKTTAYTYLRDAGVIGKGKR
jgi:hypothetical protein